MEMMEGLLNWFMFRIVKNLDIILAGMPWNVFGGVFEDAWMKVGEYLGVHVGDKGFFYIVPIFVC